jgi:hypothetical protein
MNSDIPNIDSGTRALAEYLDLKSIHGTVTHDGHVYLVSVNNSQGRWVFSGKLVEEWQGFPVRYDFGSPFGVRS